MEEINKKTEHSQAEHGNEEALEREKKGKNKKRNILFLFLLFFLLSNIAFYLNERSHWINDKHAHLQAKEYFIVGDMVFFYRKMLNTFFEVDNPIMYPLNKLQEVIYNKGIQYLLENDAERAVWKYKFFHYFYARRTYFPKECKDLQHEAYSDNTYSWSVPCGNKIKLLEEFYSTIETLGTLPIADKEIQEMRYKIFPLLVSYYSYKYVYYFGQKPGLYMRIRLIEDEKRFSQLLKMFEWLSVFKSQWQADEKLKKEIEYYNPTIAVSHYEVSLEFLQLILFKMFRDNEVNCNSPYISFYLENRKLMLGVGNTKAPINLISKGQKETIIDMYFKGWFTEALSYKLHKECNIEIPYNYPTDEWIIKNKALIEEKFNVQKDKKWLITL